jgi:hypothetical protein
MRGLRRAGAGRKGEGGGRDRKVVKMEGGRRKMGKGK